MKSLKDKGIYINLEVPEYVKNEHAYNIGDLVSFGNRIYKSLKAHVTNESVEPIDALSDVTKWQLIGMYGFTNAMVWPVFKENHEYNEGDIFRTNDIPSWGYYKVISAGNSSSDIPNLTEEDDVFTSGSMTCQLVRIGSGNNNTKGQGIEQWFSGRESIVGDIVIYKNNLYECISDNINSIFDKTEWNKLGDTSITKWTPDMYYETGEMVNYNNNVYICIEEHVSSKNFDTDYDRYRWNQVDNDITAVSSDGGYSQVTKVNIPANTQVIIPIAYSKTMCKPPIEILRHESKDVNIDEIESTYSVNETANYENNRFIVLDDMLHEKTTVDYKYTTKESFAESKIYESEEIDLTDYKSVKGVTV